MRRCGQCTVIQPGLLCEQLCEQTHSRAVFGSFHAEHKDRSPLNGPIAATDANSPVYQLVRPRCKVLAGIHSRDRNESEWERILRCQTVYSVQRCSRRQHKYVFPFPQGQTCCIPSLNTHHNRSRHLSTTKHSHQQVLCHFTNLQPLRTTSAQHQPKAHTTIPIGRGDSRRTISPLQTHDDI